MTPDGFILTNSHVVRDAKELEVTLDGQNLKARVIGEDPEIGLVVICVDVSGFQPAALAAAQALRVGQLVVAIGSPLGSRPR